MTTTTMPNNILIGSEKLFRTKAPWRINRSLLGQITNDHNVILFNHDPQVLTYKRKAKDIGLSVYRTKKPSEGKIIFIGLGEECAIAPELVSLGFELDAAVFVNNNQPTNIYDNLLAQTAIYNFYTSEEYSFLNIQGAECNQYVKTYLPAHMSNRLATEIAGCLIYQTYEATYLTSTPAVFSTI